MIVHPKMHFYLSLIVNFQKIPTPVLKPAYRFLLFLFSFALILYGCKSSEEFTGFDYDPPDVTDTTTKPIVQQPYRVIGAGDPKVWISNEFMGARMNNFIQNEHGEFILTIKPELAPINNSPWYAFKIWSDSVQTVTLTLAYEDGEHRYYPDISSNGANWVPIDSAAFYADSSSGTARLTLEVSPKPVWVSAQEIQTTTHFENWLKNSSNKPFVTTNTIGHSHQKRAIKEIIISSVQEYESAGVLVVLGRQHPPEIPGYLTCLYFLEEIMGNSDVAARFRENFVVLAYPMMNPDGADNGHWRYNAGGVDLNRDWWYFNQPETQAVSEAITNFMSQSLRTAVYGIDFHSTDENLFYPILPKIEKPGGDITYEWIEDIQQAFPETVFSTEPFDTSSPIAKNWFFNTFGIDALTYEVSDMIPRDEAEDIARYAAQSLMKQLLEKNGNSF